MARRVGGTRRDIIRECWRKRDRSGRLRQASAEGS